MYPKIKDMEGTPFLDRQKHPWMLLMKRDRVGAMTLASNAAAALDTACDGDAVSRKTTFRLCRWNGQDWVSVTDAGSLLDQARADFLKNIPECVVQHRDVIVSTAREVDERAERWQIAIDSRGVFA